MPPSQAGPRDRARAEALRREIVYHERKYYVDNDPQISDPEFDRLVAGLRELEARFPDIVTPESPTQRVGEKPAEGFPSVVHRTPMLSIDNGYAEEEIRAFEDRVRKLLPDRAIAYTAELKIDGLGISVLYRDGKFARAVTRGDGVRGDDVSGNVKTIRALPLAIEAGGEVEVRGEIYLSFASFREINREREEAGEAVGRPAVFLGRDGPPDLLRRLEAGVVLAHQAQPDVRRQVLLHPFQESERVVDGAGENEVPDDQAAAGRSVRG